MHTHWSQFVPNNYVNPTSEGIKLHIIVIIDRGSHKTNWISYILDSQDNFLKLRRQVRVSRFGLAVRR